MRLEKKDVIIIILSISLIISAMVNLSLSTLPPAIETPNPTRLIIGIERDPQSLDPIDTWDYNSQYIIDQVVERLWWYDFTDPHMPRKHMLAINETWISSTQLRVYLRNNVSFHDGKPFNADAVKWNLNRLMYLFNHTGELSSEERRGSPHSLFEFPNGAPIFDHFEVVNSYTVDIFLTAPYSPIMDAMCFVSCGMLSPTSHASDAQSFVNLSTGDLVGTGPFMYDYYFSEAWIDLTRWEEYWKEPASFSKLVFKIIKDSFIRNYAMVKNDIDILIGANVELYDIFNKSSSITIRELEFPSSEYSFLSMNINKINSTWRKAISYAINYSYLLKTARDYYDYPSNKLIRAQGPVSPLLYGYDSLFKGPFYNLSYAREIMASMGFGDISWNNTQWLSANFTEFKYSYTYVGSVPTLKRLIYTLFSENLAQIGISLKDDGRNPLYCTWSCIPWDDDLNYLDLYWSDFAADYLDPINIFLPLFSNLSDQSFAQVNDAWLELKFKEALKELNETKRYMIYSKIQHYISEDLLPHIFGYHSKPYVIHSADLYNVPYNSFGIIYAYPIKRNNTLSTLIGNLP